MEVQLTAQQMAALALERFSVSKYAGAPELTVLDWRSLIGFRAEIISNIEWVSGVDSDLRLRYYIQRISESPLSVLRATFRTYEAAVTDVSVMDVFDVCGAITRSAPRLSQLASELERLEEETVPASLHEMSDSEIDELMRQIDLQDEHRKELSIPLKSIYGEDAGIVFVALDVTAPDDILIEHFREWLRLTRRDSGKKTKTITEADLRKWAQHRVLAYIDLRILSKLAGVELTNSSVGARIFADLNDVDVAEKVRKTTAPIADWLLSEEGADALFAVANSEQRKLVGKNWG